MSRSDMRDLTFRQIGSQASIKFSTIDLPTRKRIEERSIMLVLIQPLHSIVRTCVGERGETARDLVGAVSGWRRHEYLQISKSAVAALRPPSASIPA